MALGPIARRKVRGLLSGWLTEGNSSQAALRACLVSQGDAEMALPCRIGDCTDFYISVHHATAVGRQFRPDNPLLPNYKWVPIGYHGRALSIQVSGSSFRRPAGQVKAADAPTPMLSASRRLDYELEVGIVIGGGNAQGERVTMDCAEDHLFGLTLFNDWSARDIQGLEYQALGPFLSKNFASTLSPWVVSMEALEPFRCAFRRLDADPEPLPYLDSASNRERGAFDVELEVLLQTDVMRRSGHAGDRISRSNFAYAYWTPAQLVAHHTVNGCTLQPGDLLGSGTLSGPLPAEAGSLLELTVGGKQPLTLSCGKQRTFLDDGDTVILRGYYHGEGRRRIGFGECRGTVMPACLG
jgi:fumarylacetoacetase